MAHPCGIRRACVRVKIIIKELPVATVFKDHDGRIGLILHTSFHPHHGTTLVSVDLVGLQQNGLWAHTYADEPLSDLEIL